MVLLMTVVNTGWSGDDLKPWPEAESGEVRWVFRVPELDNEQNYQVEILVGRDHEVDCNKLFIGGTLTRETIKGWGYPLYRIGEIRPGASTLMACPENEPKTVQFVAVRGDGFQQRYNSKLPYVVYVPEGYQVKYRVWSAGDEAEAAVE